MFFFYGSYDRSVAPLCSFCLFFAYLTCLCLLFPPSGVSTFTLFQPLKTMSKPVIVDAKDHMLGRLASVVAKQLLLGQKVVVVRCDKICVSGSMMRNKIKYHHFLRKRTNTNPKQGPFHWRSPCKMFQRVVRGMLPHKTQRGQIAFHRLAVFDGVPSPFDTQKRMVVPDAVRATRLAPGRKFTVLGELAQEVGWKHKDLIERMEAQRVVKSRAHYMQKKAERRERAALIAKTDLSSVTPVLEAHGYA